MPQINIIINTENSYYVQFLLDRNPKEGEELPLKRSFCYMDRFSDIRGVYKLFEVKRPPQHLRIFQWEVKLQKIRDLCASDNPIRVGIYD